MRILRCGLLVLLAACRKSESQPIPASSAPPLEPPLVAPPVMAAPNDGTSVSVVPTDGGFHISGKIDLSGAQPVSQGAPADIPEAAFDPEMDGRSFTRPLGELFVFTPYVAAGDTAIEYACSKPVSKTLGKPKQDPGSPLWSWNVKPAGKHTISVECKSPKTKKKQTTTVTLTVQPKA